MFKVSEKVEAMVIQSYGEEHPVVTTVAVGMPLLQILMILMVFTSIISELTKFFTKKKSANSSSLVRGLPPKDCSVSRED